MGGQELRMEGTRPVPHWDHSIDQPIFGPGNVSISDAVRWARCPAPGFACTPYAPSTLYRSRTADGVIAALSSSLAVQHTSPAHTPLLRSSRHC
mmetsp:Transcript_22341/g.69318  ORF Transcript_22341/g.69318 Transcript_22341/m.69318 type:complete len:94 (-) Transcript_22341:17-298(-)